MNIEILTSMELQLLKKYLEHLKRYGVSIDKGLRQLSKVLERRQSEQSVTVACLVQLIQQHGAIAGAVDELVHDAASEVAAETNNAGLERQLNWLLDQGCAPGFILKQLGIRAPRMATAEARLSA